MVASRTSAYETVSRARVDAIESPVLDHVADAAHGRDQPLLMTRVDLLAEMVDHYVHDVGARIEMIAPRVFGDERPAHHATGVAHEVLEHRVFLRRELDRFAGALDLA